MNPSNHTPNTSGERPINHNESQPTGETGDYWRLRYLQLEVEYQKLQQINQSLEDKLLRIVESYEQKKVELMANIECEKSTLMADVNKLSTKLVDARIRLHDYEEKEMLHASECSSPCHKGLPDRQSARSPIMTTTANYKAPNGLTQEQILSMNNDPNLV